MGQNAPIIRLMKKSYRRLLTLGLGLLSVAAGLAIFFTLFKEAMVFYYTPSEVKSKSIQIGRPIRIGGVVKKGSQTILPQGGYVFTLEDKNHEILIRYKGLLPTLFKEGSAAVVKGSLQEDGTFLAAEVLAKHDENYRPKIRGVA
jgi:cytochrome c-type biogenesis protein CcmE